MNRESIGVIICSCSGRNLGKQEIDSITQRLSFAESGIRNMIIETALCGEDTLKSLRNEVEKKGISSLIIAGCGAARISGVTEKIADALSFAPSSILGVPLFYSEGAESEKNKLGINEARVDKAVRGISRGMNVLTSQEPLEIEEIPVVQRALVIGGGAAGIYTADALNRFGHETVLVEKKDSLSDYGIDEKKLKDLEGVIIHTGSSLVSLEGSKGNFSACVKTPGGLEEYQAGAVVIASGAPVPADPKKYLQNRFGSSSAVPLFSLATAYSGLPRIPSLRRIGILLDLDRDEGRASTQMALHAAQEIQKPNAAEVFLFLRDARVGSLHLEELYDAVRDMGVTIVKYSGEAKISSLETGLQVTVQDDGLGVLTDYTCDLLGISPFGCAAEEDDPLSEITGVHLDDYGQFQDNNIQLMPVETNIPGIFTAGGGRGEVYSPKVKQEALAAAGEVHFLLKNKTLHLERSEAQVDPDKCILCLTCIRCCPHGAMHVNREDGVAECSTAACQRCGICAGECPAKAISLPVWTDEIVLNQL